MTEQERKQQAEETVEKIKETVKKGNIARIIVRKGDNLYANIPLNVGIVGTALGIATAPWVMLFGVLVTVGADCQVELHKVDGSVVDISGKTVARKAADVGSAVCEDIKKACAPKEAAGE